MANVFDQFDAKAGNPFDQFDPPPKTWGETALDALHSAGTGIAEGAIGLAGLPGDLAGLETAGLNKLFGTSPEDQAKMAAMGVAAPAPTSSGIQGGIESVTGKFYEPQTTTGKYARSVGQMVPAAAAGPGSLVRKAAMAVVPGVTSEAAGQAAEMAGAPDIAPWARLAGGLAGGLGAAKIGTGGALAEMRAAAPSAEDVAAKTDSSYAALRAHDIQLPKESFLPAKQQLAADFGTRDVHGAPVATSLKQRFDTALAPAPKRSLFTNMWGQQELSPLVPDTRTVPLNEMENIRKDAAAAARDIKLSDTERSGAGTVVSAIEKYYASVPGLNETMAPIREMARRNILAKQIDEMARKGGETVAGLESGVRNKFSSFMQSQGKGLTPTEQAAYRAVVRREGGQNLMHMAGSRFSLPALGFTMGSLVPGVGHIAGAGIGLGTHLLARKLMENMTEGAVNRTRQTVLAGKAAQSAALTAAQKQKLDALARALLSGAGSAENAFPSPTP